MFKGFRQIAFLTVISRILGMLRDMSFAFFFGATGLMDSWVIAFMIPNLARRLFGEGASSSSLIPVYSEQLHKDRASADRLASTVLTVIFVILAIIVLTGELVIWIWYGFADTGPLRFKLALTAIMLPYMIMICLTAVIGGVLNSHRHFAAPAIAPVVLNIFIIGSLFFSGWVLSIEPSGKLYFVAFGVLCAGFVQLLMQIPALKSHRVRLSPAWDVRTEAFRKIILLMAPMIVGLTATQINTLADVLIARTFSGSVVKGSSFMIFGSEIAYPMFDGAASMLFYAQRLYQFPLGVFGISLATAIFPVMSADAARRDMQALCKTISRGIGGAVFIAAPAAAGLLLVGSQLTAVLFERGQFSGADTAMTSRILAFYAVGLAGFFLQQLAARAFYSLGDSAVPTRSALAAVAVNVVLNLVLIWPLGAAGLALSTALCSYLQVAVLLAALRGRLGGDIFEGIAAELAKIAANTLIMFVLTALLLKRLGSLPQIVQLAAAVPFAAAVYWTGAVVMKIEMLSLLGRRKKAL